MKRTLLLATIFMSSALFAAEVKTAKGAAPAQPPAAPNLMTSADFTPNYKV